MNDRGATAQTLILDARRRFENAGLVDAASDARFLICGVLGWSTTSLVLNGDTPLADADVEAIGAAILRRLAREPVHRILGRREFYGLDLKLSSGTLEPRPDTEVLVETMLPYLQQVVATKGLARIADLGTGTGAIALALLRECGEARALGIDISEDALATAMANATANDLGARFETRAGPWFAQTPECFDIIVSNPPYIRSDVVKSLDLEVVDHDPILALDGGPDGLDAYRAIAQTALEHLMDGGFIGLEIGFDQHAALVQLFEQSGFFLVEARRDYGGQDRVLVFARKS